jgi:hypothetical protein
MRFPRSIRPEHSDEVLGWRSPWALGCCLCFLAGIAAIGWPVLQDGGFPLDDSWIHQTIGRNAARYGVPGLAPGIASSGATSPLWPWIIAVNYRLLPAVSPVAYLLIFNSLCLLAILALLFALARHDGLSAFEAALLAALVALNGNCVWLIASGMEHLLCVAALFGAAVVWLHPRRAGHGSAAAAGALCGLAILTRPESAVLLPVFLLAGLRVRRSRVAVLAFLLPSAFAVVLLVLNTVWVSHSLSLVPGTFSGRRWLIAPDMGSRPLHAVARFAQDTAVHVVRHVLGIRLGAVGTVAAVALTATILAAGLARLIGRSAWRICFLVALAAANYAFYCVVLPGKGHGMRYQTLALVLVFPLVAFGMLELVDRVAARLGVSASGRGACRGAVVALVAMLALASLADWNRITDAGIKHINGTQVRMGKWLAQHLPAGTPVASFDIGAIGYFSGDRLLDLGGLADPQIVPYLYAKRIPEYLRARGIRWVVLPVQPSPQDALVPDSCDHALSLCDGAGLSKRKVVSFTSPYDLWERGNAATAHAARSQWLYEITWSQ